MTNSAASLLAIFLGVGVFLVIVAVGWRSVQNRRIVRMQGADGQETIIVASEDDVVTNVVTATITETAEPPSAAVPSGGGVNTTVEDPAPTSV